MTEIICWLDQLKVHLQLESENGIPSLVHAVNHTPEAVFGPIYTEQHSEALAYWFAACQQLHRRYQQQGDSERAYSYQQFAYSKLQALVSDPQQDPAMTRWCLKKLDRMIISMMEFCQQQSTDRWQQEGAALVELHVIYMQGQQHMNLAYSPTPSTR